MRHDVPKKKPSARKPPSSSRADLSKPAAASNTVQPPSSKGPSVSSHQPGAASSSSGGTCPLRKFLGPSLSGLIFNSAGHIQCPAPIIQARALLAATTPVQQLRPQALPIKLLAVGALAAALNVPCGMWREHTEKFSKQWFLAVHASIPFVAMLRKAVIMPKIAIVCTIACAIAGQAIGARLERARLAKEAATPGDLSVVKACAALPSASADLALLKSSAHKAVQATAKDRPRRGAKARRDAAKLEVSKVSGGRVDSRQPEASSVSGSCWWQEAPGVGTFKQLLALQLPAVCVS